MAGKKKSEPARTQAVSRLILPYDAGAAALHEFLHFLLGRHRSVPRRRRGKGTVRRAIING